MDGLTAFGLVAVSAMLVCYALEARGRRYVLLFAGACLMGSAYGFLQGAWPFGLVEAVWAAVAARRWWLTPRRTRTFGEPDPGRPGKPAAGGTGRR